jgi:hypothetical protein
MATSYTNDKKIGALDPITGTLSSNDETVVNKNGDTLKATMSQVEAFVFASKSNLTPSAGESAVAIVRQSDGSLRQVALADIVPPQNITNAKVSNTAAIAGTKISPDFGSQNIVTTGGVSATTFTGAVSGNASTASALQTARDLSLTGDVTATINFSGASNASGAATLANSGVSAGTYNNVASEVRPFTVDAKGRVTAVGAAVPIVLDFSSITGSAYKGSVRLATTANLTAAYSNGTGGVGATLTNNGTLGALSVDGVSVSTSDRILVKNQTSTAHNGIYIVTNTGSGSVAWVLTRATDADAAADTGAAMVSVISGATNGGKLYITTFKTTDTVGTTAQPWFELLSGGPNVVTTSMITDGAVTAAKIDPAAKINGAQGGGSDRVFYENDQTVTTNYTISTNKNAMSAGPITVNNGITVTVPNGSTWTIV